MTVASLSRHAVDARAGSPIPAGIQPARMPPGSAFHAPAFVGKNGDVT